MAKKKALVEDDVEAKIVKEEKTITKEEILIKKRAFSLNDYKKDHDLNKVKFKNQEWLEFPSAFQNALGIKGLPLGFISILRGHSDTGKTTAFLIAAAAAQKKGILPCFIITELKWSWEHAKMMGLEFTEIKNEKDEVIGYDGFFLYVDIGTIKSIEDVAEFINKTLDDQKTGKLPYDLLFLWDSIGSVPSQMSIDKGKNNNEWNAGAMSVQFGGHINQRIGMSRKEEFPYTNTLICTNKIWVAKAANPMAQPKLESKCGKTMFSDAAIVITFGGIQNSSTQKIKAIKNGREVLFGSIVKVQVEKNHLNGISTLNRIIAVPTGFIANEKKEIDVYKKEHLSYFAKMLGGGNENEDFDTVIDENEDAKVEEGSDSLE